MAKGRTRKPSTAANVGFEAQLWQMADALRGSSAELPTAPAIDPPATGVGLAVSAQNHIGYFAWLEYIIVILAPTGRSRTMAGPATEA